MLVGIAHGFAETPVRFTLSWSFEGATSFWTLAEARGCFAREGLGLTIDRGYGSGDTVTKVAAGAYNLGAADFNTMVEFNGANPTHKLIALFVISDASPMSVAVLRGSGISQPRDLAGKRVADTDGEASRVMFPAFAKANGLDPAAVHWISVAPGLRQQLLTQGRTDAIAGHSYNMLLGLRTLGLRDEQVDLLRYRDWGVDFYGDVVVATPAWLAAHAQAARSFVRCAVEGIKAAIADPGAAIASVRSRSPFNDDPALRASLDFALTTIVTPDVRAHGLSAVSADRLTRTVAQATDALGLAMPPITDLWTDAYLPPREALTLP